jgi:23S rRNA pseudouridine2605 synthase
LQKVLAAAGLGSRRDCETLIQEGRVQVDGRVAQELGVRVDPTRQEIRVDGVVLPRPKRVYYVVNKPSGVLCTNWDPSGRTRVIDLVPAEQRLFTVGRLDRSSEGLIVVTNDGDFANRLTHPRYGVEKTYTVRVAGTMTPETIQRLRRGVHLAEGPARVESLRVKGRYKQSTDLEIVLNEGRNRELRRILARVGHKVLQLRRIALGPVRMGELPVGAFRVLTADEVRSLRRSADESKVAAWAGQGAGPRPGGSRRKLAQLKAAAGRRTRPAKAAAPRPEPQGSVLDYEEPGATTAKRPDPRRRLVPPQGDDTTGDEAKPQPSGRRPEPSGRRRKGGRKPGRKPGRPGGGGHRQGRGKGQR